MSWILPLLVAVPLLTAAAIAGGDHVMPSRVQDALAVCAAGATCGLGIVLMLESEQHEEIQWFGGWHPRGGVAIGIDFTGGPISAGMAAVIGGVVFLALVFSWSYLERASRLVDALMLVCCGAMCGFVLSGDVFNLFVWLELMGVAAYALTGFEVSQLGPLQGAVNFAIVNSVGGFFVAIGIALVYARTGALNLAQIGHTLAHEKTDGLVVVAMTLLFCGFLCKAAVVPFHLWLADAYAVAPAPVCAIFAGAMTDIGLYGVARVYWTIFDAPFGAHSVSVEHVLLALGVLTGLVGAVMAFLQRHLKRMLAYTVIAHIGVMLTGIALLGSPKGLGGAADFLLAHAFLLVGLFLASGVLIASCGSIDELALHGKGRRLPWLAAVWFVGAVALAGPPYGGIYLGHALIDDAAAEAGIQWLQPLIWLAEAIASAALLRAGARVFLGWGPDRDPLLSPEMDEEPPERGVRLAALAPPVVLATALGAAISVLPGLAQRTVAGAGAFRDRAGYVRFVLHGLPPPHETGLPFTVAHTTLESLLYGGGSLVVSILLALAGLYRARLGGALTAAAARLLRPPVDLLKAVHSGVIGDYVMWVTVGTAVTGAVWALLLR